MEGFATIPDISRGEQYDVARFRLCTVETVVMGKANTSKNMAERNSKVGIRTKIEAKIKLFNIAVKDVERTEMYVSSFFDE